MKKFFKTTIQIEILSEVKYNSTDLEQIKYDITEGHCSGVVDVKGYEELTPAQAAKALRAQGSDPEFFNLNDEGEVVEEDWTREYSTERDHESYTEEEEFKVGDSVIWTDPDEDTAGKDPSGTSSGVYTVIEIKGEELRLKNEAGSEVGAYAHECQPNDLVTLERGPIWKDIRNDFEDDGLIHIDAWTSDADDDTDGKVIAKVSVETGEVTYLDDRAKTDKNAQEAIKEAIQYSTKKGLEE